MDIRESVSNQNDVSLLLAKHLVSTKASDANLVFSPPDFKSANKFLKFKSTEELNSVSSQLVTLVFTDGGSRLSFVNGIWVDRSLSLKPTFKKIVKNAYNAAASHVDFQTKASEVTEEVNLWAEKETNGIIKEILPSGSVDCLTRLIFANAVYFKGAWKQKFDSSNTNDDNFFLLNGSSVQVPFMTSNKKQYIRAFSGFKVLGHPYEQGEDKRKFSTYFFLPDAKDGLPALLEKIGSESGFLDNHLPYRQEVVGAFRISKFKISFGFEASEVLKGLGLVLPFSRNGLTEMVDTPVAQSLFVSNIFHKMFIEVNENGTKTAAATAGVVSEKCLPVKWDFVADHPFLFVVREDTTGLLLFIGQIHNPLSD
ncbi:serpin-ZX-like [Olea europaea subsp. europaea]|uniref:Serpin-ZX-like n=1 Tax=Olea europaea subsp. europaea TaxID=158383 RepID=A0A8S0PG96_OLEEU|nr:serpin-ZX-like [Olea europaea subsp. europaea]